MSCEECEFFDEHPFIREGDCFDYCKLTKKPINNVKSCDDLISEIDSKISEFFNEMSVKYNIVINYNDFNWDFEVR